MIKKAAVLALALAQFNLLALPLAAQQAGAAAGPVAAVPSGGAVLVSDSSYQVSAGDAVGVTVFPADEYSREVTVQPDGKIELPLLGPVLIKGLTAKDISTLLEGKYAHFVANPRITVSLKRYAGRRIAIIGDVRGGGYYEYRDGMKMLDLLAMAGGLTDFAKPSKTRILRVGADKPEAIRVNLKAALKGDFNRNVRLMPNDIVYVPRGGATLGAQWTNTNILPWVSLMTLIASLIITSKGVKN